VALHSSEKVAFSNSILTTSKDNYCHHHHQQQHIIITHFTERQHRKTNVFTVFIMCHLNLTWVPDTGFLIQSMSWFLFCTNIALEDYTTQKLSTCVLKIQMVRV